MYHTPHPSGSRLNRRNQARDMARRAKAFYWKSFKEGKVMTLKLVRDYRSFSFYAALDIVQSPQRYAVKK